MELSCPFRQGSCEKEGCAIFYAQQKECAFLFFAKDLPKAIDFLAKSIPQPPIPKKPL